MKVANKEMSVRKLWTSNELLDAVSARKAVSIGKLRGEALRAATSYAIARPSTFATRSASSPV